MMKEHNWIELTIFLKDDPPTPLTSISIDNIASQIASIFNCGVSINDVSNSITVYFKEEDLFKDKDAILKNLLNILGNIKFTLNINQLKNEDWHSSWKKYFRPIRIGKRFIVTPSWERQFYDATDSNNSQGINANDPLVIKIDPGPAFGTGTHASTQLSIELLEKIWEDAKTRIKAVRVLDCGAGSGILAIAAAKLGASKCVLIDIDYDALKEAKKNVCLNKVQGKCIISETKCNELNEKFNIILANIEKNVLVNLSKEFTKLLLPNGVIICSGILISQKRHLISAFKELSLYPILERTHKEDGEWMAIAFKKKTHH